MTGFHIFESLSKSILFK